MSWLMSSGQEAESIIYTESVSRIKKQSDFLIETDGFIDYGAKYATFSFFNQKIGHIFDRKERKKSRLQGAPPTDEEGNLSR